MNFDPTESQELIRQTVREFSEREIAPNVMVYDEAGEFPYDVIKGLSELGVMGLLFPEELQGAGAGYLDYATAIEELARVDPSVSLTVAAHISLCANHIFLVGTEEQRRRWVPALASGSKLGGWALTEPGCGSDASALQSTARREGDEWVLSGTKTFCTNGGVGDIVVTFARTSPGEGARGISAFVVEKGTEGFTPGKKENKLGMRASDTSELIFENCRVPDSHRLGPEGEGFIQAMRILDGGRIGIAALALGIGQGAFEASVRFAKQREAFGRPITQFQAIQWKIADMATELDAARLLTYRAASLKDAGAESTSRESSMAKLFASEAAQRICEQAVQLHGGYGFIKDYPVEKFYRDVKLTTIGEGTSEIQRLVIARKLLD